MKKKFLSLLICAAMLLTQLPAVTFADEATGTKEDPIPIKLGEIQKNTSVDSEGHWSDRGYFSFTPEKDGVYTVIGYNGETLEGARIKPATDNPYSAYLYAGTPFVFDPIMTSADWIQVIDEGRYYNTQTGKYVTWDFDPVKGILTIDPGPDGGDMGQYGFDRSYFPWYSVEDKIIHVIIGEDITAVPDEAFASQASAIEAWRHTYESLKDVSFPSTLRYIGKEAFYKCPALKEVSFPAALESIGEDAFFYCTSLESAVFNGPTTVGAYAFQGCSALADVTVNDPNMTEIYDMAFYNTPWIRILAAENKGAAVVNNVLIGAYAAYDKKEGDGILIIPDGVKKIIPFALNNTTTHPAGGEQGEAYMGLP